MIIYRADNYNANTGDLQGFFKNLEDAKDALNFENEIEANDADGNFGQVTEFEVDFKVFDEEFKDVKFMLNVWEEGEIIRDYYFK